MSIEQTTYLQIAGKILLSILTCYKTFVPLRNSVFPFRRRRIPITHILYKFRISCHIFLSIASRSCKISISMECHLGFEIDQDLLVLCFFRKGSDKRPTFEKDTLLALSVGSLSCCQHMSPS